MNNFKKTETQKLFLTPQFVFEGKDRHILAIFCITCILIILGLLNLYSACAGSELFYNQIKRIFLGLFLLITIGWFIPIKTINHYAYILLGINIILLIIVLLTGKMGGGAQRWINLGIFTIQPSEFIKITLPIFVAKFFYLRQQQYPYKLYDLWILLIIIAIIFILILIQPDLGTAGCCLLIVLGQLFFIRINLKSIWLLIPSSIITVIISWFFILKDYQKLRILNLFNPSIDPQGTGYNAIQSLISVGSGNLIGKGFLKGTQNQLQFLPARHTDFIFSVFAEEHGFLGAIILIILFLTLIYLMLNIAKKAINTFSSLLAVGLVSFIFFQVFINIAMVIGIFPIVGIPLPFFSYGGSSLIATFSAIGLIIAIHRQTLGAEIKEKTLSYFKSIS